MNVTPFRISIVKAIRSLGIFGIMLALASAFAVGSHPASASSLEPTGRTGVGKVAVSVEFKPSTSDIKKASVILRNDRGIIVARGTTSNTASGIFVAEATEGMYKVYVSAQGYTEYSELIKVSATQAITVKASLNSTVVSPVTSVVADSYGKLSIHVNFGAYRDATQATIRVVDTMGNTVAKSTLDAMGNYATYITPGAYKVTIFADGFKEFSEVVRIASGGATRLNATLSPR